MCEHYVYVLQSKKDKSIYIGYTSDLKRRVEEHNKGLCTSTKDRIPFGLAAYEAYFSESDARTRERRLKQFKNAYKELMKRINNCLAK
ncbi:MAG: GIY-YIG nuclease family protein [Candidatus Omnitrophota bacterium]